MRKPNVKLLSSLLALTLAGSLVAGCGQAAPAASSAPVSASVSASASESAAATESAPASAEAKTYDKTITIDNFNSQANYQGVQSGWFAKVVKDKFNMEINIIAPNVAGGGDTLFQTRSAAGNLGDLVMIGAENGRLADTVKAGLMYDISDLVAGSANLPKYQKAIDNIKNLIASDKVYAVPSAVTTLPATTPSEGLDLTYGPYIRWDLYTALGNPVIRTQEDILPILKQMQEKEPASPTGKKVYGISLFKDWDGNMMCLAKQPACMYGYDESGFLLVSADGKTTQSIIDSNSEYVRALKFYFTANQMGLLDPDSSTQNFDTLFAKYQDGQVLWSPWPWLGQAAYNTLENKAAGKGFMIAPMEDQKIFSYGANPSGGKYVIGVGSQAQDPERMVDFIDWLYSPEGVMMSCAQTSGSCGPEGLTWEMKDGQATLTTFGEKAFSGDAALTMPDEWGGGTYKDGISQLNYQAVLTMETNPVNNLPYNYSLWPSYLASKSTPLDNAWKTFMKADTTLDYLTQHSMFAVAPGNSYIPAAAPTEIDTLRNQCKAIIIENSWKMVFAKDEATFNSLLAEMQNTVKGLGYDDVLKFDLEVAANIATARAEAVK